MNWWKKLFGRPEPEPFTYANKILLSFVINDYIGSDSDLNGCINDQKLVAEKLIGFQHRLYKDTQVTKHVFATACEDAFLKAKAGDVIVVHYSGHGTQVSDPHGDETDGYDEALYLYDGVFTDDAFHLVLDKIPEGVRVILLIDSCFSGTITRFGNPIPMKSRFVQTEPRLYYKRVKPLIRHPEDPRWIVYSGCSEHQTSADAMINGVWQGAFTFYAMYTFNNNLTYRTWQEQIRLYLPNKNFDQAPTLEGPEDLLDFLVLT